MGKENIHKNQKKNIKQLDIMIMQKMHQYKRDLDEQRRQLQQRKDAQKKKELDEALKLEQKIKNDRQQLIKQQAMEDRDGGIFGSNVENEKMKKAKKWKHINKN